MTMWTKYLEGKDQAWSWEGGSKMATYIVPPSQLPHTLYMRAPAEDIIELRAPDSSSRPFTDGEMRHALDTDSGSSPFIAVYSSLSAIEGLAPGQEARIYLLDTAKLR
jgi:hypothetical protein